MDTERRAKNEALYQRCSLISEWHRTLGYDFPATDIDFPLIEYDSGVACALIEYKHENATRLDLNHPSIRALRNLADRARIPFFVVRYTEDLSLFVFRAINGYAYKWIECTKELMSESAFKGFLKRLRKEKTK